MRHKNSFAADSPKLKDQCIPQHLDYVVLFLTKVFLNSIIAFKGKECEVETFGNKGYLLRFKFGNYYELKIYDKGLQYGLNGA